MLCGFEHLRGSTFKIHRSQTYLGTPFLRLFLILTTVQDAQDDFDITDDPRHVEIPSPQDIEMVHEAPVEESLSMNFYQNTRRVPVLQLERLSLVSNCMLGTDRVDLRALKLASPALFPGDCTVGQGGEFSSRKESKKTTGSENNESETEAAKKKKTKKKNSSKEGGVKSEAAIKVKVTKPKKKPEVVEKLPVSSSSDSDTDEELAKMRQRIMKPNKFAEKKTETSVNSDVVKEAREKLLNKKPVKKETKPAKVEEPKAKLPSLPARGRQLFKPCGVKLNRLSDKQILKWTSGNKAAQKQRSFSISSHSSVKSKSVIDHDSSSDEEPEKKERRISVSSSTSSVKKKLVKPKDVSDRDSSSDRAPEKEKPKKERHTSVASSTSSVKKKPPNNAVNSDSSSDSETEKPKPVEKQPASSENKPKTLLANPFAKAKTGGTDKKVQEALLETLFTLLNKDEKDSGEKKEGNLKEPEAKKETEVKKDEIKRDEKDPEKLAKSERDKTLPFLYANNKESVDVKRIAELRPFADLLMIEMGADSLSFLGNYRITLKELETIVHKVITKLDTPRPLEKPSNLPQASSYEKAKYKLKDLDVKLKDMKTQEAFSKAVKVYKSESHFRIRRRKRKLLQYLNHLAENRKSESSSKRKVVASSDESDVEMTPKAKKVKHDVRYEEPSHLTGFK